jgi:hypothetical protein
VPTPIEAIIIASATAHGVDPYTAIACAKAESDLDPEAVGDHGTSFGLFQLHRGGELGDLTREEAFDPKTNADVALTVMGRVAEKHPGVTPGVLAALAQRPAAADAYAKRVNNLFEGLCSPVRTRLYRMLRIHSPFLSGSDVHALQQRLRVTTAGGQYGPLTRDAVRKYQSTHTALAVDGIVGPHTAAALGWVWAG